MIPFDTKEPITITPACTLNRRCDFCTAEEGKIRVMGRFVVKLRSVNISGVEKLACQSCSRKNKLVRASIRLETEKRIKEHQVPHPQIRSSYLKRIISTMGSLFIFMLLLSTAVMAQPAFPAQPDQTPIDGGLGILAAAGGAYAIKKLRDKNKES